MSSYSLQYEGVDSSMTRGFLAITVGVFLFFSAWFANSSSAQTSPTTTSSANEFPDWLKTGLGISGLTCGPGVLVWYLWYNETKVKPRQERIWLERLNEMSIRHEARMKETEERHARHWEMSHNMSREDLQTMAKGWREDMAANVKSNDELTKSLRELAEVMGAGACKFTPSVTGPKHV